MLNAEDTVVLVLKNITTKAWSNGGKSPGSFSRGTR
jgi:hypothetical protein